MASNLKLIESSNLGELSDKILPARFDSRHDFPNMKGLDSPRFNISCLSLEMKSPSENGNGT